VKAGNRLEAGSQNFSLANEFLDAEDGSINQREG
jgi:hypothetical protein